MPIVEMTPEIQKKANTQGPQMVSLTRKKELTAEQLRVIAEKKEKQ